MLEFLSKPCKLIKTVMHMKLGTRDIISYLESSSRWYLAQVQVNQIFHRGCSPQHQPCILNSYLCDEDVIFLLDLLPDAPQPLQSFHLTLTLLPLLGSAQHSTHQHHRYLQQHPHPCIEERGEVRAGTLHNT